MPSEAEFAQVFQGRARGLRRTAYLLCGDWHRAEDLVQATFVKLYVAWPRVQDVDAVDAFLRTTLVRTYLDQSRRRWHGERPTEAVPDLPVDAATRQVEDRVVLMAALDRLPPRQRACLVLRYYQDCSVEQAAAALGCSVGTVKSTTSRGLDALRALLPALDLTVADLEGVAP